MSDAVDVPETLTPERKARLAELVEIHEYMTVDELLYMVAAYESLAMRVATRRSSWAF